MLCTGYEKGGVLWDKCMNPLMPRSTPPWMRLPLIDSLFQPLQARIQADLA